MERASSMWCSYPLVLNTLTMNIILNNKVMKRIAILTTILLLCATLAGAQDKQTTSKQSGAQITATETEFDFGTIKEVDGPVSHTFTIKNTGNAPLVLTRVVASCGCTKPEFETAPIAPGKTTTIKVTYNPAGRPGQFVKTISIYSNGKDGSYILRIKGVVE